MKNEKDIGDLIQERLTGVTVNANPELWTSIDRKLDKRKKKRLFFFWISTSSMLAVLLFVGIMSFDSDPDKNDFQVVGEDLNESDFQPIIAPIIYKETKDDSLTDQNNRNTDTIPNKNVVVKVQTKEQASKISDLPTTKKKETAAKNTDPFQGFEKKTTYYYYNSKDSVSVKSQNKKVIDSLVEKGDVIIDSTSN